jgi:hypothetical protein
MTHTKAEPSNAAAVSPNPSSATAITKVAKRKTKAPIASSGDAGAAPPVVQIPVATGNAPSTGVATSATNGASASSSNPIPVSATLAAASPAPAGVPMVGDDPPTARVPKVPLTFVPQGLSRFRGFYPNRLALAAMPGALVDLARFTDYDAKLGNATVATSATVALSINRGIAWRKLRDASESWDAYVKTQDALAWKTAMTLLADVRTLFELAVSKNSSLAAAYPRLVELLDASKAGVKQAAVTRANKAKAAAKTATDTLVANTAAAATAAATEAANKANAAAAPTTPKVTIST